MKIFDTIAAIATPVGLGGISIIRISGDSAIECANNIVFPCCGKTISRIESHKLSLCHIRRKADSALLDQALVAVMRGPNSYTGEDVVEINCHGGYRTAEAVLEELFLCGARQAEAGEFTRRAFMNGKVDLLKAEATVDLIHSNSALGQENAARTLSGQLSEKVAAIRNDAVLFAANLSAIADYPDEIDEMPQEELLEKTNSIANRIDEMLAGFKKGKIMRDGITTVIAGRPNVGKSSLLNAISRTDRAIVTDIPGTTRDTVEEYVTIKGLALRLIDTAGIRESDNAVERIGIERAKENMRDAQLCLLVIDSSCELTPGDVEIAEYAKDKHIIVILNKTDKGMARDVDYFAKGLNINKEAFVQTATPGSGEIIGIDALEDKIVEMFMSGSISKDDVFISNDRQKDALIKAQKMAESMKEGIRGGMPADILYVDLEELISALGEITGETVQDEIIDKVFERFCVGK